MQELDATAAWAAYLMGCHPYDVKLYGEGISENGFTVAGYNGPGMFSDSLAIVRLNEQTGTASTGFFSKSAVLRQGEGDYSKGAFHLLRSYVEIANPDSPNDNSA